MQWICASMVSHIMTWTVNSSLYFFDMHNQIQKVVALLWLPIYFTLILPFKPLRM